MWPFKTKKTPEKEDVKWPHFHGKEPERFYIPAENLRRFYELKDAVKESGTDLATFEYWEYIGSVIPEVKEWSTKTWGVGGVITAPYVYPLD